MEQGEGVEKGEGTEEGWGGGTGEWIERENIGSHL